MLVGLVNELQLFADEIPHLQPLLELGNCLLILVGLGIVVMKDIVDNMINMNVSVLDEEGNDL